jgi:SAM-dependent methyltransferase
VEDADALTSGTPDVSALVDELRHRIEQRRREGFYPDRLEQDLEAHFQRIAAHRPAPYDYSELHRRLAGLDHAMGFSPAHIPYDSGLPGGAALHRVVGKAVSRQTAGILEQMITFGNAVRDLFRELLVALEHPNAHVHSELLGQVDALMERIGELDRVATSTGSLASDAALLRRIERLEAAERNREFHPWFSNERFESKFRGAEADLLDRYDDLARRFVGCDGVVDLGCGRGEFIELLRTHGVSACGVEIDPSLVDRCRTKDLDVVHADAVEWLAAAADGTLGGISMIQVIEHLSAQQRVDVVRLAADKLRPGGRLLIETVNPQSLYIFARAFYVDPTHDTPVHPAYLEFLLKEAGFGEIAIEWRSDPPADEVLQAVPASENPADLGGDNVGRVNRLLFGPQDYAIFATR